MVLLALSTMKPGVAAVFFLIAFVCFLVHFLGRNRWRDGAYSFLGLGLAAWVFVLLWERVAAA